MIEKSKKAVDSKMVFGALLSDLSKTFDSISHDHPIAKLHTYGLLFLAMKQIQGYLQNRKQRTKVGTTRQDKLSQFIKMLNYNKSSYVTFSVIIFKYSQYICYSQKELKYFGPELSLLYEY